MKVHLDCFPCFVKQALIAGRLGAKDPALQAEVVRGVLDDMKATDMLKPPAYSTTFIHRKIRLILGKDPFKDIKSEYNQIALDLYPELKKKIQHSSDPLNIAARLAIAGNVIDFGIFTSVDIVGTIERALNNPLTIDRSNEFAHALNKTADILYLLDNAGEIVFDRLLIEVLAGMGKKVKAVVKGEAVLNDSTAEDAFESGLSDVCEIIDNGSDCVGTIIELTSESFQREFSKSGFVISKGQGNFETLWQTPHEKGRMIFYLFQAKCDVVSKELGLSKGSMLLMSNET
jgi:uncharacterized protein with ATP-grasp and redox domains